MSHRPIAMYSPRLLWTLFACLALPCGAQHQLRNANGGAPHLFNSDLAVIESPQARFDIPCQVRMHKPVLGFDLRYHSGYEVLLPLEDTIAESHMTVIFRVTPVDATSVDGAPAYFSQKIGVGVLPEQLAPGKIMSFEGRFDLGPGTYKVEWMLRDRHDRVCSHFATLRTPPAKGEVQLEAGKVAVTDENLFIEEPPVQVAAAAPTIPSAHVLLNFAPSRQAAATFDENDKRALVSILRLLARDPRIGKLSLTVFNLEHRKVLFRDRSGRIDFPSLGRAVDTVELGTISVESLEREDASTRFLASLIDEAAGEGPGDPIMFLGPSAWLRGSADMLNEFAGRASRPRLTYLNYNPAPHLNPWSDVIDQTVRTFKGRRFGIHQPQDLWRVWPQIFTGLRGDIP